MKDEDKTGNVRVLTPEASQAIEESRRLIDGLTADTGAVQVVMTAREFWSFKQHVRSSQKELYEIPEGRPDLPTYGTRYSRRFG